MKQVIDKQHLKVYETLWMKKLKSINEKQSFVIANLTHKKIADKQHYEKNKEEIKKDTKNKLKAKVPTKKK